MKLYFLIKKFFYSEEKRSSENQMKKDFGDFPPSPLNCKNTDCNFNVVRTRWIGSLYYNLFIIKKLFQASESEMDSLRSESTAIFTKITLDIRKSFKDFLCASTVLFKKSKFKFSILIFSTVAILVILAPAYVIWTVFMFFKINRNMNTALGLFIPPFNGEWQITIRPGANKKRRNEESIISHEHIHLLQHRDFDKHNRNMKYPDMLILDKYKDEKYFLYLLEKKEVEARLHEVILSYYREKKELPLTLEGFFELLAGSNQIGKLIILSFKSKGINIKKDIIKYQEREIMFAEQVVDIFTVIKSVDLIYKFITEVLTVMYGNLINFYGDEESSRGFMEKIERPNLYDALYVDEEIPA
jgi:hypothetical protein